MTRAIVLVTLLPILLPTIAGASPWPRAWQLREGTFTLEVSEPGFDRADQGSATLFRDGQTEPIWWISRYVWHGALSADGRFLVARHIPDTGQPEQTFVFYDNGKEVGRATLTGTTFDRLVGDRIRPSPEGVEWIDGTTYHWSRAGARYTFDVRDGRLLTERRPLRFGTTLTAGVLVVLLANTLYRRRKERWPGVVVWCVEIGVVFCIGALLR